MVFVPLALSLPKSSHFNHSRSSQASSQPLKAIHAPVKVIPYGFSTLYKAVVADQIPISNRPPVPMPGLSHAVTHLRYGVIHWQGHSYVFALGNVGKMPKMWIDSNHNGRFGDDPSPTWTVSTHKSANSLTKIGFGMAVIDIDFKGVETPCRIGIYDLITKANHTSTENVSAYADFGFSSNVSLDHKTYPAYFQFPHLGSNELSLNSA